MLAKNISEHARGPCSLFHVDIHCRLRVTVQCGYLSIFACVFGCVLLEAPRRRSAQKLGARPCCVRDNCRRRSTRAKAPQALRCCDRRSHQSALHTCWGTPNRRADAGLILGNYLTLKSQSPARLARPCPLRRSNGRPPPHPPWAHRT